MTMLDSVKALVWQGRAQANTGKPKRPKNDTMFCYFLSELSVRIKRVGSDFGGDEKKKAIFDEIESCYSALKSNASALRIDALWNEAYRIERLMVLIEPAENLWGEVKRRLGEATEESVFSLARLNGAAEALGPMAQSAGGLTPEHEAQIRAFLLQILEEIHWDVQRKYCSRPIRKSATRRIVMLGMVAFLFLIAPYFAMYFDYQTSGNIKSVEAWSWLPLYSSLTAGLFGALFSRLLYLQQRWDTLTIGGLKDAREFTSIVLRGCVGMTGAVIVSFFLQAGVLSGGLFPAFPNIGLQVTDVPSSQQVGAGALHFAGALDFASFHLILPDKDLALLFVWSFLAGFSERLVPTILQDTETAMGKKA